MYRLGSKRRQTSDEVDASDRLMATQVSLATPSDAVPGEQHMSPWLQGTAQ